MAGNFGLQYIEYPILSFGEFYIRRIANNYDTISALKSTKWMTEL